MKLHRIALSLLAFVAITVAASACAKSTLDLNLKSHAARAEFMTPVTSTGLYANIGYLYNEHRGDLLNAGIHLIGDAGVGPNPLHAGIGGQLYYANPDFHPRCGNECILNGGPRHFSSGEALAIGGFLQYQLPGYNRIGFGGHIYYSPGIISFGGLERFMEYGVRADYQVLRSASVYVGYRQVKGDFGPGFYDIDSGFHLGMQLRF